ncbi:MAG: hypothetical protein Kow0063_09350 [Anaerolineae bacterium]
MPAEEGSQRQEWPAKKQGKGQHDHYEIQKAQEIFHNLNTMVCNRALWQVL